MPMNRARTITNDTNLAFHLPYPWKSFVAIVKFMHDLTSILCTDILICIQRHTLIHETFVRMVFFWFMSVSFSRFQLLFLLFVTYWISQASNCKFFFFGVCAAAADVVVLFHYYKSRPHTYVIYAVTCVYMCATKMIWIFRFHSTYSNCLRQAPICRLIYIFSHQHQRHTHTHTSKRQRKTKFSVAKCRFFVCVFTMRRFHVLETQFTFEWFDEVKETRKKDCATAWHCVNIMFVKCSSCSFFLFVSFWVSAFKVHKMI